MRWRQKCPWSNAQTAEEREKKGPGKGPTQVTQTQMWGDLLAAGIDQDWPSA